ncbi:hypothetical protein Barb4_02649 [Bacteroidales bacterium Barb4]|nr:hypothetical protein Barb4_02649 [Bacteroidales bacterium Barb4]
MGGEYERHRQESSARTTVYPYSYDSRKCIDIVFLIILIISDYGKHPVYELRPDNVQDRHFILSLRRLSFHNSRAVPPCTLWRRPELPCVKGL